MTSGGWIIMIIAVGTVVSLFSWCMWKVLTTPQETEHMHGFSGSEETPDTKPPFHH